jgi:hypothetical protein
MLNVKLLPLTMPLAAVAAGAALLLAESGGSALQAPRMSLDMAIAGTSYDAATNTMVLGPIQNCLTTAPSGNNAQHFHIVHLILQDAGDVIGWQARLNYDGGKMRPAAANFSPFSDATRGQNISFTSLPIDPASGVHREISSASDIPPAAAGAQTAAIGAVYVGDQNAPVSPDTPAKTPPDDTSYSAPGGGILATVNLQVLPGQVGQGTLNIDLDDGSPNAPGSGLAVFDGAASQAVYLDESALLDGFHAEAATCVPPAGITPVVGDDPGFSEPPPGDGAGFGTSVPGEPTSGVTSPGAATGTATRTAGQSPDQTGNTGGNPSDGDGANDQGDGGTSFWVYVLVIIVVALIAGGAFAAWRYRSRLPWL